MRGPGILPDFAPTILALLVGSVVLPAPALGQEPRSADSGHVWPQSDPAPPVQSTGTSAEVDALFSGALRMLKSNQSFQARQLLERAAELEPNSPGIHCNLGLAYQNSGNISKAISEFQTALKLVPNMPEATLNIAGCYQSLGESREAILWFEKYLQVSPQAADAAQVRDIIAALKTVGAKAGANPNPNLPDYLESATADGTYRWPRAKLPIKVYIEPGAGVEGFRSSFRQALVAAFDVWVAASADRLAYVLVSDPGSADVVCDWTSNPQEVSRAGTQSERGIAEIVATSGNEIRRATIKILTRPMIEEGVLSDDDMKKACLHEVGHVLGLQGHSANNHDVMFFTIDTATVWPVLTKRDKATIAKLYAGYPQLKQSAQSQ